MAVKKVLVSGCSGQLGQCLQDHELKELDAIYLDRSNFDLTSKDSMARALDLYKPDYVVNCAAYTNVDGAESDRDAAANINHFGVMDLANLCSERRIKIVHVSTDFVFDGKDRKPYQPSDLCSPLGVYGQTKLLGELALAQIMPEDTMVIRTSWLYSEYGANFVKTMLRLFETKDTFRVVHNQQGSPTYAQGLASLIWHVLETRQFSSGVYHWCDKGITTWYDFANEIGRRALEKGIISKKGTAFPILSSEYLTAAERPMYSALYSYPTLKRYPKIRQLPWQDQLDHMLDELVDKNVA
ncbi:MAG: dTDP-4-dehydrorhamnose reductase [Porticoccaceae bacterium]|jgi:dTDP-4-dehydrorhamnose reductase